MNQVFRAVGTPSMLFRHNFTGYEALTRKYRRHRRSACPRAARLDCRS